MKRFVRSAGFTLIELLVVMVIIGILATLTVPSFRGYFAKARDSKRQATVNSLATLIRIEAADNQSSRPYEFTLGDISDMMEETDYRLDVENGGPEDAQGFCYYYGYSEDGNDFFVATAREEKYSEDTGTLPFVAGTPRGMMTVEEQNLFSCDTQDVGDKSGYNDVSTLIYSPGTN